MVFIASDIMVDDLNRDGFTIVRSAFDEDVLCRLEEELVRLQDLFSKKPDANNKRDIHFVDTKNAVLSSLHNIHVYSEFWCDLVRTSGLIGLVKKTYGTVNERVYNGSFFAKPAHKGLATATHQDNAYNYIKGGEILTAWIALDRANSENGGLFYYAGSHNLGDVEHLPVGNVGASMAVTREKIRQLGLADPVRLDLHRGDCVIHNALVIHGSDGNDSDMPRRGCNFSITSKADLDRDAFAAYEEKLNAFLDEKKPD